MKKHVIKVKYLEAALVTLVSITSLTLYVIKQFSSPLLYGIDGPYYYIQISSILNSGVPKYPDPPLSFYILTAFSIILGDIYAE